MFGFQAAVQRRSWTGIRSNTRKRLRPRIRIGNPASWQGANNALKESKGHIDKVTDDEILATYKLVARTEGIFAEPASTAPLAGIIKCQKAGMIPAGAVLTVTLTGHGLKDPDTAIKAAGFEPFVTKPDKNAVMKIIGI
jgi:threonine synthase